MQTVQITLHTRSVSNLILISLKCSAKTPPKQDSAHHRLLFWCGRRLAGLDARPDYGRRAESGMVSGSDRFSNLSCMTATLQVLLTDSLLDSVNLVLIPLPISHGALLGLLQCGFKRLKKALIPFEFTFFIQR